MLEMHDDSKWILDSVQPILVMALLKKSFKASATLEHHSTKDKNGRRTKIKKCLKTYVENNKVKKFSVYVGSIPHHMCLTVRAYRPMLSLARICWMSKVFSLESSIAAAFSAA